MSNTELDTIIKLKYGNLFSIDAYLQSLPQSLLQAVFAQLIEDGSISYNVHYVRNQLARRLVDPEYFEETDHMLQLHIEEYASRN